MWVVDKATIGPRGNLYRYSAARTAKPTRHRPFDASELSAGGCPIGARTFRSRRCLEVIAVSGTSASRFGGFSGPSIAPWSTEFWIQIGLDAEGVGKGFRELEIRSWKQDEDK